MQNILFIITGGTIDSVWSGAKDTAVVAEHSILPGYFEKLQRNLKFPYEISFKEICMKDSREITDDDRENVLKAIENSKADKIIITHGTFTMPVTARFLESKLKENKRTIILTGSMVPIEGFDFSDGPFNLGFTISEVLKQDPGIYVCMNSQTFTASEVAKNVEEGRFYSIFKEKQ